MSNDGVIIFKAFATVAALFLTILSFIFREQAAKVLRLLAGIIWRVVIIPFAVASPAVGWWLLQAGGEKTGWWEPSPMPPGVDFDRFFWWTAVGLAAYLVIGRTVRAAGDVVRAAWKDAQPDEPEERSDRPSGGGNGIRGTLEARVIVLEAKTAATAKSLATRNRNTAKMKQRLDELEARLNLLKGDAPNDGEEV